MKRALWPLLVALALAAVPAAGGRTGTPTSRRSRSPRWSTSSWQPRAGRGRLQRARDRRRPELSAESGARIWTPARSPTSSGWRRLGSGEERYLELGAQRPPAARMCALEDASLAAGPEGSPAEETSFMLVDQQASCYPREDCDTYERSYKKKYKDDDGDKKTKIVEQVFRDCDEYWRCQSERLYEVAIDDRALRDASPLPEGMSVSCAGIAAAWAGTPTLSSCRRAICRAICWRSTAIPTRQDRERPRPSARRSARARPCPRAPQGQESGRARPRRGQTCEQAPERIDRRRRLGGDADHRPAGRPGVEQPAGQREIGGREQQQRADRRERDQAEQSAGLVGQQRGRGPAAGRRGSPARGRCARRTDDARRGRPRHGTSAARRTAPGRDWRGRSSAPGGAASRAGRARQEVVRERGGHDHGVGERERQLRQDGELERRPEVRPGRARRPPARPAAR